MFLLLLNLFTQMCFVAFFPTHPCGERWICGVVDSIIFSHRSQREMIQTNLDGLPHYFVDGFMGW